MYVCKCVCVCMCVYVWVCVCVTREEAHTYLEEEVGALAFRQIPTYKSFVRPTTALQTAVFRADFFSVLLILQCNRRFQFHTLR